MNIKRKQNLNATSATPSAMTLRGGSNGGLMAVTNLQERFGRKYKVVDDGSDDQCRDERVWCQEIRGRHGVIYPCGVGGTLAVRVESKTHIKNSLIAAKLVQEGFKVMQLGDWEMVFSFEPEQLDYLADLIKAKKRKRLSPENKAKALAALAKAKQSRNKRRALS